MPLLQTPPPVVRLSTASIRSKRIPKVRLYAAPGSAVRLPAADAVSTRFLLRLIGVRHAGACFLPGDFAPMPRRAFGFVRRNGPFFGFLSPKAYLSYRLSGLPRAARDAGVAARLAYAGLDGETRPLRRLSSCARMLLEWLAHAEVKSVLLFPLPFFISKADGRLLAAVFARVTRDGGTVLIGGSRPALGRMRRFEAAGANPMPDAAKKPADMPRRSNEYPV
ncbi:MAG: hypothetical protein LBM78_02245 [Clostridiales bacterium]|nr:hypothetical protein [Clostridiales bacterium]